jgi:VWFA-related protein
MRRPVTLGLAGIWIPTGRSAKATLAMGIGIMKISGAWRRVLCIASLMLFLHSSSRPESPQKKELDGFKFTVQSQLVEVYATVAHGKRLIPNLKASDFRIFEDGMPAQIDRLDDRDVPLQIVLLFDASESIRPSLKTVQDSAIAFIESLHTQDRVMLTVFNSRIQSSEQTTADRGQIIREIKNTQAQGTTRLFEAMLLGMKHLAGKPGRKAIVCFTDGQDTSGTMSQAAIMNATAQFGFPVYMIGAGAAMELATLKTTLQEFAEINSGRAIFIQSLSRLREAFLEVAAELRSSYVLNYYTRIPPDGRWHALSVTTTDPAHAVHARKGFFARP